jgi:Domain of unknown function (DUF4279)
VASYFADRQVGSEFQEQSPGMNTEITMTAGRALMIFAIYLRGKELDPTFISHTLGVEPSRAQKSGLFDGGSHQFMADVGLWRLKLMSDSVPAEKMIESLLEKIGSPPLPLNQITGVEAAYLELFFVWDDAPNESVEFRLTKDHLSKISQLGLDARFIISAPKREYSGGQG